MADRYWVGGTGNWNSTNTGNWSATSGGASGASAPVAGDDVYFDANSDSGLAFTVTVVATGPTIRNLTVSGLDQTMALAGSAAWNIEGSISLPASNFSWSATGIVTLSGASSSRTILTNGVTINGGLTFNSAGSDWTLQSALTIGSNDTLLIIAGTFNSAGYAISARSVRADLGTATREINLGASTVTLSGATTNCWQFGASTNLTFDAGTSTLLFTSSTARTFEGGGLTYNIVSQSGAGAMTMQGSNTFADIQNAYKSTGATSIIFTAGTTQTVSAFTASGEAGRVLTLQSSSAGTPATLSKASGTVSVDYMSISDTTATGGASWYAGVNSTNVTPATNGDWTFTAPPGSGGTGNFFMFFG